MKKVLIKKYVSFPKLKNKLANKQSQYQIRLKCKLIQLVYINQMFDFFKKIVNYQDQQQIQANINREIAAQISLDNAASLQAQAQEFISNSQKIIGYEQKIISKVFTQEEVSQLTKLYSNIVEYYALKNNDEMCKKYTDKIHDLLKLPRVNSVLNGKKSCYDEEKKIFQQNIKQSVKQVKLEAIARKEQQAIIKKCEVTRKRLQCQMNKQDVRLKVRIQNRSNSRSKKIASKKDIVTSPAKSNNLDNNLKNHSQKPPLIPKP